MYTETLAPHTQETFELLAKTAVLDPFYLSGGTALALHLGHRESEDLDFFSKEDFDPMTLQIQLQNNLALKEVSLDSGTLNCYANEVKLQFLHYPYKLLSDPKVWNGVAISSIEDIACTKLITISARGSKKDFIDLFFILQIYSLEDLFELLPKKYDGVGYNLLHILKSLVFFEEAEAQPSPRMHKNVSWSEVKKFITDAVKDFKI